MTTPMHLLTPAAALLLLAACQPKFTDDSGSDTDTTDTDTNTDDTSDTLSLIHI